jgi:hypothetical protein
MISSGSWTPWYTVHTHAEDAPVPEPEAQIDQYQTNMNCTRRRTISDTDDDCNRTGSGRRHEDRCCIWVWKERNGGIICRLVSKRLRHEAAASVRNTALFVIIALVINRGGGPPVTKLSGERMARAQAVWKMWRTCVRRRDAWWALLRHNLAFPPPPTELVSRCFESLKWTSTFPTLLLAPDLLNTHPAPTFPRRGINPSKTAHSRTTRTENRRVSAAVLS